MRKRNSEKTYRKYNKQDERKKSRRDIEHAKYRSNRLASMEGFNN